MHPGQCMSRSSLPPHCKRQGHRSPHVCTCTSRKIISPNINKSLFFSNICSVLHAFNKSVNHKHIHVGTGTCICLKIQEYNASYVVDEGNTKPLRKRSYLNESKPIVNATSITLQSPAQKHTSNPIHLHCEKQFRTMNRKKFLSLFVNNWSDATNLQWTTVGATSYSVPLSVTFRKNCRSWNASGTPWSGQAVKWYWVTILLSSVWNMSIFNKIQYLVYGSLGKKNFNIKFMDHCKKKRKENHKGWHFIYDEKE